MRIAIVGSGISGLVASYLLHQDHQITVFEANDYIGGHTHTVDVELEGCQYAVDTGFIVFNERNYPNFVKLLDQLKVPSQPSEMSFSVQSQDIGLEYSGTSLNTLFSQRSNLLSLPFHQMLWDIFRFNRHAKRLLKNGRLNLTLGEFLKSGGYGRFFREYYLIPMTAAIWSARPDTLLNSPFEFFARFFLNHGMLDLSGRPQWRVIQGGSKQYVKSLTASFGDCIRLATPVKSIVRQQSEVKVETVAGSWETFDRIVLATHSDQALRLLAQPTELEKEILGAIPYQENETILHFDASVLPRAKRAWASWNYHRPEQPSERLSMTYNMNILQSLNAKPVFCVTLNPFQEIDPAKVLKRITYHHPVYTTQAVLAQKRHGEINGRNNTYFCGAYWGNGFHEDGVNSALEVAKYFGKSL